MIGTNTQKKKKHTRMYDNLQLQVNEKKKKQKKHL